MKQKAIFLLAFLLSVTFAGNASARIDFEITSNFNTTENPLDIASSLDGKFIFVLSKGQVAIYNKNGKLKETIAVDKAMNRISVSGLAMAGLDDKIYLSSENTKKIQEISYTFVVHIDTTGSPFLGTAAAPVEVVVFSDFQCPHCSRLGPLFEQILEANPETVKIVHKDFPLRGHKKARPAAVAAQAAHEQGKFWEFHDELYKNMRDLTPKKFTEIATKLDLDLEKFKKDQTSPAISQRIAKDQRDASQAGVHGTPSLFVNGRRVKNRNFITIQKMITEELNRVKK
jgi:protein-disulfide isomerase